VYIYLYRLSIKRLLIASLFHITLPVFFEFIKHGLRLKEVFAFDSTFGIQKATV
jgi:hypothetical protein